MVKRCPGDSEAVPLWAEFGGPGVSPQELFTPFTLFVQVISHPSTWILPLHQKPPTCE